METTLLIIHAILAVVLIIVVLVQRAEGGALGIGGGSDGMSPRGSADILTRTTAISCCIICYYKYKPNCFKFKIVR